MKILLIRHGKAEEAPSLGGADEKRSLTAEGRQMIDKMALDLSRLEERIDKIVTSPYKRAVETAEIIGGKFRVGVENLNALSPLGSMEEALAWLKAQSRQGVFVLVGHEPMMSHLTGWLLFGKPSPRIEYKTGTACLLACPDEPRAGNFSLLWCLPAELIQKLGS